MGRITKSYLQEYLANTSIHGFRYFEAKRSYFEKLWWFIVFASCLGTCAYLIRSVYRKWEESPIIINFNTVPYRIYEIPFPSITVCSASKMKKDFYDKLNEEDFRLRMQENALNNEERELLSYATSICPNIIKQIRNGYKYVNLSQNFFDIMVEKTPEFKITNCYFLKKNRTCKELFTKIITDSGVCQTFNILDRKQFFNEYVYIYKDFHSNNRTVGNWTMDGGYPKNTPLQTYPERALLSGAQNSLEFQLQISEKEVFQNSICGEKVAGFIALLHIPLRIPRLTTHFIRIPLGSSVVAAIQPSKIMAAKSFTMDFYKPSIRHCYFQSERPLYYYKNYSQNNCEMECLANMTQAICGCVDYYMPYKAGNRICNGNDLACKKDLADKLIIEEMKDKKERRKSGIKPCDCLPLCVDVTYHSSISQAYWAPLKSETSETHDQDKDDPGTSHSFNETTKENYNFSQFTVYFMSGDLIGSERVEFYGPSDFLANFGGLLSLFTGFSILSLMELIYFLTIRWCCNLVMFGRFTEAED